MSGTDELLLKIFFRNYDEEERRNGLIDNKNSQMIVLTGTMLTLQATLFSVGLLNEFVYNKIIINPVKFWIYAVLNNST
ncbi:MULTISPECIES: hypothetical protein [Methanobrevibacter]|uniref:Uncharacterized protein n=1 Tax=Methanobrevibacter gottschalkii DSM 11977 TaxID=1122229 RepID=A0A3N5B1H8_9EURY|nr:MULTISPECIES: hypothetical protein [Methanobrevibacter]OEC94504.1 hypothetical protein A9505_08510 [Methanobrevibacter sp. A27]RPF51009.1 hypothetical protein EDC42_1673 [Methanobrevibacter gottschalkii DSM 11977]